MLKKGTAEFYQPQYAEPQYFVNCIINYQFPSSEDALRDLEIIEDSYRHMV